MGCKVGRSTSTNGFSDFPGPLFLLCLVGEKLQENEEDFSTFVWLLITRQILIDIFYELESKILLTVFHIFFRTFLENLTNLG